MMGADIGRALLRAARPGPPFLEPLLLPEEPTGKVGLLPGSFDPMTLAHAALAEALRDRGADPVVFVYSTRTLPKGGTVEPPLLTPERRLRALVAFCEKRKGFGVALCSHGLYADQAEAAATMFPGADLEIGVGSDKILQIFDPSWYEDSDAALGLLFSRARVIYAVRGEDEAALGQTLEANPRWAGRMERIDLSSDLSGISSRAVREAARRGENVSALIPPEAVPFLR